MSTPILATKLYIPPPRPNIVRRPRLIEQLNEGLRRKMILISAPAGFGKTTLVSSWINDLRTDTLQENQVVTRKPNIVNQVVWFSLDEADNEPVQFFSYVITALRHIAAEIGQTAQNMLHSPQPPSPQALMTMLINDIAVLPQAFVFVLDDYHVIDSQPLHQAIAFLLDHLPPPMHLVVITRTDPPLPLSRLRARNQMTELREGSLRFTREEVTLFLNTMMGLPLSAQDLQVLEARTEGWVAGLQLAALSMQNRADITAFISSFSGSHRYILDYLTDEVLSRQPEGTRRRRLASSGSRPRAPRRHPPGRTWPHAGQARRNHVRPPRRTRFEGSPGTTDVQYPARLRLKACRQRGG